MLESDQAKTEAMLKNVGEERMRFALLVFCLNTEYYPMSRRAGRLLDVARDGYYDSAKCIEDFEKVY